MFQNSVWNSFSSHYVRMISNYLKSYCVVTYMLLVVISLLNKEDRSWKNRRNEKKNNVSQPIVKKSVRNSRKTNGDNYNDSQWIIKINEKKYGVLKINCN